MNTTTQPEAKDIVFLRGHKVTLRPLSKSDALIVTPWINDPEVTQFLAQVFPLSPEEEERHIENMSKDTSKNIVLGIITEGKLIGVMGIHSINWVNRTATTGAFIGEKEYWGKGYGTDAKMAILEYAFNTLNLRYLMSSVIAYNKRSLNYSLHCGYVMEGSRRKKFFKKGKYWNEIMLGLFKKEWLPYYAKWKKQVKKRTGQSRPKEK